MNINMIYNPETGLYNHEPTRGRTKILYVTLEDYINHVVIPSLGSLADGFDIDRIARRATRKDSKGRFFESVGTDDYWRIVRDSEY